MPRTFTFDNDFGAIGMGFADEAAFAALVEKAVEGARAIPVDGGSYLIAEDPHGAEFWMLLDESRSVIAAHPYFRGSGSIASNITEVVDDPTDLGLEAVLHAWAEPDAEAEGGEGIYPYLLACIDWSLHKTRPLPFPKTVRVNAMPREITMFPSVMAYDAAQTDSEVPLSSEAFVPLGLFDEKGGAPMPVAWFNGVVERSAGYVNPIGGGAYAWVLTRTLGGQVDVMIDRSVMPDLPRPGSVLSVTAWLGTVFSDRVPGR